MGRDLFALGAALLGAALFASEAGAQSLFAGRGLGFVVEPLDARARSLGGVGLGLHEPSLSMISPASVAGLPAPVLHVTVQPDQFSSTHDGVDVSTSTVRFPVIHAALPFRRWTATLGYAAFLDRNWAVETESSLDLGGSSVGVRDRFASHGGVARLRLGTAYTPFTGLAFGAAVDIYSGSVQDTTYRVFDDIALNPTISFSSLAFRGVGYGGGVRWVPSQAFAMDAAVSGGGELEIRVDDETTRRHDLPIQGAVGASGQLTPQLGLSVAGRWSGWSSVDEAFAAQGGARDTWSLGGGVEWEAIRLANHVIPLRVGARRAQLPFRWNDGVDSDSWADERALTFGTGLRLGGGAAMIDLGVERGERGGDGAGITESFWRMAFSLTVLGR